MRKGKMAQLNVPLEPGLLVRGQILIRLMTHLGQFRAESNFSTWMYRIASNTLLNIHQRDRTRKNVSFDGLSLRLEESIARYDESTEETYADSELSEEVRRSCTLGMLMCLNHEERLSLILGEVLEVSGAEGAYIMGISEPAYRKRLSRARQLLIGFVSQNCGIVNPSHPCRCHKHVKNKIDFGLLNPQQLCYANITDEASTQQLMQAQRDDLDSLYRSVALIRSHPQYPSTQDYRDMIRQILNAGNPDA